MGTNCYKRLKTRCFIEEKARTDPNLYTFKRSFTLKTLAADRLSFGNAKIVQGECNKVQFNC